MSSCEHVNHCSSLMWVTILVPGGDNGVVAKLNSPKMCVCTDIFGLMRDKRTNLESYFPNLLTCPTQKGDN